EDEPYFEWLRVCEAICAGCLVVSEHSTDLAPLRSGEHVITGGIDRLGLLCAWACEDASSRDRVRRDAYDLLVSERPLARAATELFAVARQIDATPCAPPSPQSRVDFLRASRQHRNVFEWQPPESAYGPTEGQMLRALKSITLANVSLRRQ